MSGLTEEQLLRLYEIEVRSAQNQVSNILRIRGLVWAAFAALASALVYTRNGYFVLASALFLGAWYWEYVYDRYLMVYVNRVNLLELWLSERLGGIPDLGSQYSKDRYSHRILASDRLPRVRQLFGSHPRLRSFLDPPRAATYVVLALGLPVLALLLGLGVSTC